MGSRRKRDPATVAVILGDDAPILECAVPVRIFNVDLTTRGIPRYDVRVVAERGKSVTSTAGVRLAAAHDFDSVERAGVVVVPGWRPPGTRRPAERVIAAVRRAHDDGATVVGLCLGAFVLAEAGVLGGHRATTHWRYTRELAAYSNVTVDADVLYVDDGQVVTSAGSAAGIDACLHVVRTMRGADAAAAIGRALVVAPHRSGGQAQFVEKPLRPTGDDAPLAEVMARALARLDDPTLTVDALASLAHMSRRTFDRQFRACTGSSPLQWLLHQRVLGAQQLLESSSLPVDAVARAVGFADAVALRPHFRRVLGVAPQTYRTTFRTP